MFRSLALVVAIGSASACLPVTEIADFPCPESGTDLTYDNFGRDFLVGYCQSCHGAVVGMRSGAPLQYDFGNAESAVVFKDRIFIRSAGDNSSMPPGPDDPPEEARFQLAEWLACGAP